MMNPSEVDQWPGDDERDHHDDDEPQPDPLVPSEKTKTGCFMDRPPRHGQNSGLRTFRQSNYFSCFWEHSESVV